MNTPEQQRTPRPNFWLRAIEHRTHQLTREYRASLGDTAREGISDEDYATTMATLETMARNLGWTEGEHGHRDAGPGHGRGFGGRRFGARFDGAGRFGETGRFGRPDRFGPAGPSAPRHPAPGNDRGETVPDVPTGSPEA